MLFESTFGNGRGVRRRIASVALVVCAAAFSARGAEAADIFVSPNGVATNPGTRNEPMTLAKALGPTSPARPGDTIWLLDGVYAGNFNTQLKGTQNAPITIRQFPGHRATLDGAGSPAVVLGVNGEWLVFWGFEITNSDPRRLSDQTGPWPYDLYRGHGVFAYGNNVKFINLVFHDLQSGIGLWAESVNSEVYGSLFYYNGWAGPDRSHGHGIYTQNSTGSRMIRENIAFSQFSHGIHAYGSEVAYLDNITFEGNVAFNNGIIGRTGFERDLLLGGGRIAQNPIIRENFTYGGAQSNLGYAAGCNNAEVSNNYLVGASPLTLVRCAPRMTGNTFYSLNAAQWGWDTFPTNVPTNTYFTKTPPANVVKVRPNLYEAGRGHVIVYNWTRQPYVDVDISSLSLSPGDVFEVRDAQNFYAAPVVTGVYQGGTVSIPMTGLTVVPAIGNVPKQPKHTGPEFAVFVVVKSADSSAPASVATPVISPAGGTFTSQVTVSISSATAGATVRYTTDGSLPTSNSPIYTAPFTLTASAVVKARAFRASMLDSGVATAAMTIAPPPPAAPPAITPGGGSFSAPVYVTIAASTPGSSIRYTTDGSMPTAASMLYAGPFALSASATVKARAFASGYSDSDVATVSFTIGSAPSVPVTPPTVPPATTAAVKFVSADAVTKGSWRGVYGRDGAIVIGDSAKAPAYAQVTPSGHLQWTWAAPTTDARGLQRSDANERLAATWYADGSYSIKLQMNDGVPHQLAMYSVDWDNIGRVQKVDVRDTASGEVLDSRSMSGFAGGQYLVWQLTGNVTIHVTRVNGRNAVVSGLFFDTVGASAPVAKAAFVGTDTATSGDWSAVYGGDGVVLAGDSTRVPNYANVAIAGQQAWTWLPWTDDARALRKNDNSGRLAATWFGTAMEIAVAVPAGSAKKVTLYAIDWDTNQRAQRIDVVDAQSGKLLDSRTISSFTSGAYLSWQVSGQVIFKVTRVAGANAVVSALFFGAP